MVLLLSCSNGLTAETEIHDRRGKKKDFKEKSDILGGQPLIYELVCFKRSSVWPVAMLPDISAARALQPMWSSRSSPLSSRAALSLARSSGFEAVSLCRNLAGLPVSKWQRAHQRLFSWPALDLCKQDLSSLLLILPTESSPCTCSEFMV
nr:hypothetical protein Iba_chr13bCG2690 [Ipomoea batatas]